MSGLAPYNVTLASTSPFFIYLPNRDGDASLTWNSSYTESPVWPPVANQQEPKGIPYRRTLSASATMEFEYLGSDVYLCLTDGGASYSLTVDGTPVPGNVGQDAACTGYPTETVLLHSSGVRMGNHKAQLKVSASSSHEFRFFGGVVTMGVTSGSSHVLSKEVDDLASGWAMVPGRDLGANGWQSGADQTSSNTIANGHSWTCIYDPVNTQSASYTFSGAGGVLLRGTIGMGLEVFSIDFDGDHFPMDATSVWPDTSGVVMFARGGLDPKKQYTIKLNNFNENYPTCDKLYYLPPSQHLLACCVNLDGLVLLGDGDGTFTSVPEPPSTPGGNAPQTPPTSTPAPNPPITDSPITSPLPLKPSPTPDPTPDPAPNHKPRTGSIVGASLGGVACAAFIVAAGLVLYFKWRKRHARKGAAGATAITPHTQIAESQPASRFSGDRQPSYVRRHKLHALADAVVPRTTDVSSTSPFGSESMEPSEARSTTTASSRQRHVAPEVLEEVLAFVAERMDGEGASRRRDPNGGEPPTLPAYRW
ncbi:hypothetical protein AURDEDRAFT_162326 [Auricularia subglabra TFB-10046 SS5]|nr:hypothetical protein AURDEDRAFT_162326 [Auricularia subglabra TFB-10046 SS5]